MDINNSQDVIDSRDVIEEIEELEKTIEDVEEEIGELESTIEDIEEEIEELKEEIEELKNANIPIKPLQIINEFKENQEEIKNKTEEIENKTEEIENKLVEIEELKNSIEDEKEDLKILKDLEDEAGSSPEWRYGEILIHESYFTEYCEELCKDIGYISKDFPWFIEVDWESTADNLKADYIEVDFGGETYLIRA